MPELLKSRASGFLCILKNLKRKGLQKCETTAPACYPGPSQSSRSVPGAGQKDQGSWDENGWESFENEHPVIMKHKCRDFLTQKFGFFKRCQELPATKKHVAANNIAIDLNKKK